jgi:dTMP kinase
MHASTLNAGYTNRFNYDVKGSRFEEEKLEFHQRVREGYLDLAHQEPDRFHIIDADRDERQVRDQIIQSLQKSINL